MDARKAGEARHYLQWVVDHTGSPELKQVATLRLARLLLQTGKTDEALALLSDTVAHGFEAVYQETRGDILVAKGDRPAARIAYTRALANSTGTSGNRQLLQMKLDDLGPSPAQQSATEAG